MLEPSTGINPGESYSDAIMRRLAPTQARQTAQLETKLMNQGIAPGTEAWNAAKQQQVQEQNDQLTSAVIGGMQTGLQANQQQFAQNVAQQQAANAANQQLFGQNQAQQAAINAAQGQLFGQNAQQAALQNAANAQAYQQALGLGQFANQAAGQQFGQNLSAQQLANQAAQQNNANALANAQFANQAAGQQFQQGLSAQALANQAAAQNTGNYANLAALQNQAAAQRLQQQLSSANLANAAQQQQFQQAAYNQMQPINVINAIRTGTQVQNPNYVNSANMPNVGGADLLGAAQNTYNAQLAATNAQNAASGNFWGGLMGLGGAALGNPNIFTGSDQSIKENIKKIGSLDNGIGIYKFEYRPEYKDTWGHGEHIGVMAQEVEKVIPEAVSTHKDGYKLVNYAMLGA